MAPGKTGRPTDLTPEVQDRICTAIRAGNYYQAACAYGHVSYGTFREWMLRGTGEHKRRGYNKVYADFANAVMAAEADAEVSLVAMWKAQVPENWQAARDLLARRFPERWSNVERIKVNPKELDAAIDLELRRLTGDNEEDGESSGTELAAVAPRSEAGDASEAEDEADAGSDS